VAQKGPLVGEVRDRPEEAEPSGIVQRDQPGEEQASEQLAEYAHREKEGRPRRYPSARGFFQSSGCCSLEGQSVRSKPCS
jgi:hypothetical protein